MSTPPQPVYPAYLLWHSNSPQNLVALNKSVFTSFHNSVDWLGHQAVLCGVHGVAGLGWRIQNDLAHMSRVLAHPVRWGVSVFFHVACSLLSSVLS